MPLDAVVQQYLQQKHTAGIVDIDELDPVVMRQEEVALRPRHGVGPSMAKVDERTIVVDGAPLRLRLLLPTARPRAGLIFLHGGGWVVGDIEDYEALARTLAVEADCAVALLEYRKAPEFPFPAALDDANALAAAAISELRGSYGEDFPVVIGGDSAGGNLAAVIAQASARGDFPRIDLQVLIYPVLDCDFDTESYLDPDNELLLTRPLMQWYWDQYVPEAESRLDAAVSPARADNLHGLPPAIVIAAEHDVLRSEGEQYVRRLRDAGVPVNYRVFPGQMHGFFSLHRVLPGSEIVRHWLVEAITDHLRALLPPRDDRKGK